MPSTDELIVVSIDGYGQTLGTEGSRRARQTTVFDKGRISLVHRIFFENNKIVFSTVVCRMNFGVLASITRDGFVGDMTDDGCDQDDDEDADDESESQFASNFDGLVPFQSFVGVALFDGLFQGEERIEECQKAERQTKQTNETSGAESRLDIGHRWMRRRLRWLRRFVVGSRCLRRCGVTVRDWRSEWRRHRR